MKVDLGKAGKFFDRTLNAVRELERAKAQLGSDLDHEALAREWTSVLSEFRKALRFMEQAARNLDCNDWADALLDERKGNKTLSYLFHARNADEHGLVVGHEGEPASLNIGGFLSVAGEGKVVMTNNRVITTMPDGRTIEQTIDGEFSTKAGRIENGWLNTSVPVSRKAAKLHLRGVEDRGKVFDAPLLKAGKPKSPETVAQEAFNWLSKKSSEIGKRIARLRE